MNDNHRIDNYAHQAAKDIWPDTSVLSDDLEALKVMAWQQLRKGTKGTLIRKIIADEYREIIRKSGAIHAAEGGKEA